LYKTKLKVNDELDKFKARLVTKDYKLEFRAYYTKVIAPVARHDTIQLLIPIVAKKSWPIFQPNVKSTFLYDDLKKQVFVDKPLGYIKKKSEHKIYKLKMPCVD